MNDVELEPQVMISALCGESLDEQRAVLDRVLNVMRARSVVLAESGQGLWAGEPTAVIVAPSSEVLWDGKIRDGVLVLARMGRVCGIHLRLLDVAEPLNEPAKSQLAVYSLDCFGGRPVLRDYAASEGMPTVTFHSLSPVEMTELAEWRMREAG